MHVHTNAFEMFVFLQGQERKVLFNDALNTFYLRLYGVCTFAGIENSI